MKLTLNEAACIVHDSIITFKEVFRLPGLVYFDDLSSVDQAIIVMQVKTMMDFVDRAVDVDLAASLYYKTAYYLGQSDDVTPRFFTLSPETRTEYKLFVSVLKPLLPFIKDS